VASPAPPPFLTAMLTPERLGRAWPEDRSALVAPLPHADRYLRDEVERALHPTLTRVWCRRGRGGQRRVQAPGTDDKRYGFGFLDWRSGRLDRELAEGRRAQPFCDQLRRAVARSRARGRVAIIIVDNLSVHTAKGSRLVRTLLAERDPHLRSVYTPASDPDSNRIEWLGRALRRAVTHTHQRASLAALLADADHWAATITPAQILRQIGSPFAHAQSDEPALDHAP
jgi:hypothetical protein